MKNVIEFLNIDTTSLKFKDINEYVKSINVSEIDEEMLDSIIEKLSLDSRKNVNILATKLLKDINKLKAEKERVALMYNFDKSFGIYNLVAGVDEVGRGPLAGPIVSCAVILKEDSMDDHILEINDSKKLSESKREKLAEIIKERAIAYSIAFCDNKEIDMKGIGVCNNQIFIDACTSLNPKPDLILSDGYLIKNIDIENKSVIKGDTKSAAIACASIVAKVYRDNLMKEYHKEFAVYDFAQNVGYGTKKHVEAILEYGPCEIHRMSFLKNILSI
ncbi:RNase HII [Clostridium cavendishii DSM 21758]|uniref:Ribonuclease HII n=1 Tax=Clostridium cavendishii DSM 21758 TaxID=1121302 RepID=A0A1M6K579_9CLOT|nr:ribonuclease HII [Clostridium cavendishii]SHJ54093.1 RNase HII [Clostridium cavendishii DSM 21758]